MAAPNYRPLDNPERTRILRKLERLIDMMPEGEDRAFVERVHRDDVGTRREIFSADVPVLKAMLEKFGIE